MAELRGDPAHDSLEVQLTEPVVFLRASPTDEGGWSGALIRGVLTLTIANAVPISSIEVELEGHAATSWEDGEGPGRIETSDEYTVYSASTVLFTLAPEMLTRDDEELLNTMGQPSQNQDTPPSYTSTEGGGVTSILVLGNDLLSSAGRSGADLPATIDQPQESSPRSLPQANEAKTTEGSCISTATPRSRSPEHHVPIARDHDRRGSSPSKFSSTITHVPDATRKHTKRCPLPPFLRGVSLSGSTSERDQLPSTAQESSQTPAAQTNSPSRCTTLESNPDSREMFRRGVYNYPFYFTLPPNVPTTTRTEDGSFTWRLHATVKQNSVGSPSTLLMTADREVEVVCYPFDDDIEEILETRDPIQLQRILDDEFACTFSFPTNAVPMGKRFPVKLEAVSLSRLRVYAFDVYVYLYEFAKYYDRSGALIGKNVSRTVVTTFGYSQHTPSDVPTFPPSPWYIRTSPCLPGAMQGFHASSPTMNSEGGIEGNLKSNVRITHILEVLIRVGRENEGVATAKEDMRDFFIHKPFMLLSPLCTAKWTNLPRYVNPSTSHNQRSNWISLPFLPRLFRSKKSTPKRTEVVSGCGELYERLMSGRESETGQAPPRYGD